MSRVKTELIEDIRKKLGVDASKVIEYLYSQGTLDDCLARQHVVKSEFVKRYVNSDASERSIHEDIADEYGLDRVRILRLVRNTHPRA